VPRHARSSGGIFEVASDLDDITVVEDARDPAGRR
jgi:hypothetical protein